MDENQPESGKQPDENGAAGGKKRGGKRHAKGERGNVPLCGAKTKSGGSCKAIAGKNGRCRMHGGASTGPSEEGRIALSEANVVTGARQRIYFKFLREDEQPAVNRIPYDAKQIVEDEIYLLEIRQKRILERIHQVEMMETEDPEIEITQESKKLGENPDVDPETGKMEWKPVYGMKDVEKKIIHKAKMDKLNELEAALDRVTALKGKYVELREKLETQNVNETDGSLDQLVKIVGEARKRYEIDKKPAGTVVDADFTVVK